jgi:predicted RNA methylase
LPVPFPSKALAPYVNKTVGLRFKGQDLRFDLSHALFSSFDIDEGTRLLLKSIAQQVDLDGVRSCLDIGCGVGVIGICISRGSPRTSVVMQDRDALAAAFAQENGRANGCAGIDVDCGLAFHHLARRSFDLVTSNLPAKAGQPVLTAFFRQVAAFLTPRGTSAVVVVAPLAGFATASIKSFGYEIIHTEATAKYTVLHFRSGAESSAERSGSESIAPYIRTKRTFSPPDTCYELETAWSLPDFDVLGYALSLSFDMLRTVPVRGELLVWNPGQGHWPAYLLEQHARAISGITLAGRDSLELEISNHNLRARGKEADLVRALPSEIGLIDLLPRGSVDFFCAAPHPIPRVPWQPEMAEAAAWIVKPGGRLHLVTTSTEAHRLLETVRGWRLLESRKRFGYRALLLERL